MRTPLERRLISLIDLASEINIPNSKAWTLFITSPLLLSNVLIAALEIVFSLFTLRTWTTFRPDTQRRPGLFGTNSIEWAYIKRSWRYKGYGKLPKGFPKYDNSFLVSNTNMFKDERTRITFYDTAIGFLAIIGEALIPLLSKFILLLKFVVYILNEF